MATKLIGFRKVPRRLDITGNIHAGEMLLGRASSMLISVEKKIDRAQKMGLDKFKQEHQTRRMSDGSVIEVWSSFGESHVHIHVPHRGGAPRRKDLECYCNCHLAIGQIVGPKRRGCYDYFDPTWTYDVEVCNLEGTYRYVLLSGVLPMLMRPYRVGQLVLVVFEPDPLTGDYTVPSREACSMISCRISHLAHSESKFKEVQR